MIVGGFCSGISTEEKTYYEVSYFRDKLGRITQKIETIEGDSIFIEPNGESLIGAGLMFSAAIDSTEFDDNCKN